MFITHSTVGIINGVIPLEQVTCETPEISEYLDLGFYNKVWYKYNVGLGELLPGIWLGVSSQTSRLICYHILTQTTSVISRPTVQWVKNLERQNKSIEDTFRKFDDEVHWRLKEEQRGYDGEKPNPQDWEDLYEFNPDFKNDFGRNFSDGTIAEADDFTPYVLDDTHLNMELTLPKDGNSAQFSKVTNELRHENGLLIGVAQDNQMLDTIIYEVEYHDGHKASLTTNTIAENLFSHVNEEGNWHVLLYCIANHRTNGTELPINKAYITSKNGGCCKRQTTKGWENLL